MRDYDRRMVQLSPLSKAGDCSLRRTNAMAVLNVNHPRIL